MASTRHSTITTTAAAAAAAIFVVGLLVYRRRPSASRDETGAVTPSNLADTSASKSTESKAKHPNAHTRLIQQPRPPVGDSLVTVLDLRNANLQEVPATIGQATSLIKLDLGGNPALTTLPAGTTTHPSLPRHPTQPHFPQLSPPFCVV
jgi:Leucine-rich repeat (LRR) protein